MKKKRSQTQYFFNVDLGKQSELRGVALLGHQTLAELHESISNARGCSTYDAFSFRLGEVKLVDGARLDDLNLRVGQTFEYAVNSINENRCEAITLDFIDNE